MLRKIIYIFISCVLMSISSEAQDDTAHLYVFGGDYYEETGELIPLQNGGYAFIGTSGSDQQNNTSFYIVILDQEFNCLRNVVLGGSGVDHGNGICEAENGDLLVTGFGTGVEGNNYNIKTYRVTNGGEVVWAKEYGGDDWDFGEKIIAHPDGGFLICGGTYSFGNGGSDGYVAHIDDDGNVISEWTYGDAGDDWYVDVDVAGNSILLSGYSEDLESELLNATVMNLDLDGLINWKKSDILLSHSSRYSNAKVWDNLLFSCGNYFSDDGHELGFMMCRYIDTGQIFWMNAEVHNGDYTFQDFLVNENNIFILGSTNAYGDGSDNGAITINDFFGAWQNAITVGAQYLSFDTGVLTEDKIVVGLKVRNQEISPLFQAGIYVYPGLEPQANSETIWHNMACFDVGVANVEVDDQVEFIRYFDLLGRPFGDVLDYDLSPVLENYSNNLLIAVYYDRNMNILHTTKVFAASH